MFCLIHSITFLCSFQDLLMLFFIFLEGGSESEVHIHWKGAAEIILDSCKSWLAADGSKHSMTPEKVISIQSFVIH